MIRGYAAVTDLTLRAAAEAVSGSADTSFCRGRDSLALPIPWSRSHEPDPSARIAERQG
jgi:hypothetical protein